MAQPSIRSFFMGFRAPRPAPPALRAAAARANTPCRQTRERSCLGVLWALSEPCVGRL